MTDDRIIDGTLFNAQNIMYSAPKATAQGAKSVNILNKASKSYLTLSTPLLLTWGASEFVDEKTGEGDGKFSLSLQFPNDEYASDDTNAFFLNMKALEEKIKADALVYSKEWFGKVQKSAEVIDALFTPMLKYPKDKLTGDYDYNKKPTMKIKLPQWKGVWQTEIYDEDGNKLFPSDNSQVTLDPLYYLKKGTNIACLIQFAGIWFVNGKFSASWKLVQAVVQKPKATLQGKCFIHLKSTDKEKLQKQVETESDDRISSTIVDDSDTEEVVERVQEIVKLVQPAPEVQVEPVKSVEQVEPVKSVEQVEQVQPAELVETSEESKTIKKKIVKKKT